MTHFFSKCGMERCQHVGCCFGSSNCRWLESQCARNANTMHFKCWSTVGNLGSDALKTLALCISNIWANGSTLSRDVCRAPVKRGTVDLFDIAGKQRLRTRVDFCPFNFCEQNCVAFRVPIRNALLSTFNAIGAHRSLVMSMLHWAHYGNGFNLCRWARRSIIVWENTQNAARSDSHLFD